jgi:hypothetical protein
VAVRVAVHQPSPASTWDDWLELGADLSSRNSTQEYPVDVDHQPTDLAVGGSDSPPSVRLERPPSAWAVAKVPKVLTRVGAVAGRCAALLDSNGLQNLERGEKRVKRGERPMGSYEDPVRTLEVELRGVEQAFRDLTAEQWQTPTKLQPLDDTQRPWTLFELTRALRLVIERSWVRIPPRALHHLR